jgi:hypothetical protein
VARQVNSPSAQPGCATSASEYRTPGISSGSCVEPLPASDRTETVVGSPSGNGRSTKSNVPSPPTVDFVITPEPGTAVFSIEHSTDAPGSMSTS